MKFADLHLHTIFSDGTYTPEQLVGQASKAGLDAISLTDHDTVNGVEPAIAAGLSSGVEVLPGIELTAQEDSSEVHILGYLINIKQKKLLEELAILKNNRIERIHKTTDKLKKLGINLDAQDVFTLAKGGIPGRLHVARAMAEKGFVANIYEAFKKHIGDKCPGYVAGFKLNPQEAIELIRNAGGVPVLAHPYSLNNDELILELVKFGLMGLEVYYPEHSQGMVNFYLDMAKKLNLLVTGGSDCHGLAKPEIKIGLIKIPYELVDKLKEAKNKL